LGALSPALRVVPPPPTADAGGNKWEAAVYAAQCGHIKRMLPVCNSWEDEAWAYCRCVFMCLREWSLQAAVPLLRRGIHLAAARMPLH
jgi:hypothetical protein